MNIVTVRRLD